MLLISGMNQVRQGHKIIRSLSFAVIFLVLLKLTIFSWSVSGSPVNSSKNTILPTSRFKCGRRQVQVDLSERIINGTRAKPNDWPWMVSVYNGSDYICGGVLITDQLVLTAAHCMWVYNTTDLTVRLGTIKKYTVPDSYTEEEPVATSSNDDPSAATGADETAPINVKHACAPRHLGNCSHFPVDLALLRLEKEVPFNASIQPICLPDHCEDAPPNASLYIAGWGMDLENISDIYDDSYSCEYEDDETETAKDESAISLPSRKNVNENRAAIETGSDDSGMADNTIEPTGSPVWHQPQKYLKQAPVKYISQNNCSKAIDHVVPSFYVCSDVQPAGGSRGDSGSPSMYELNEGWTVDAVISAIHVQECPFKETGPALYIRVSHFVQNFITPYMELVRCQPNNPDYSDVCATDDDLRKCAEAFREENSLDLDNCTIH